MAEVILDIPLSTSLSSSITLSLSLHLVICFDAKVNFDDSAKFRQKDIFDQEDTSESDPREVEANRHNLNYIGMKGNIGCMGKFNSNMCINVRDKSCLFLASSLCSQRCWSGNGYNGHYQIA